LFRAQQRDLGVIPACHRFDKPDGAAAALREIDGKKDVFDV
jgi:hypothetical protein